MCSIGDACVTRLGAHHVLLLLLLLYSTHALAPVITTHVARVVLFSVVSVCVFVCLSVNTITPEPLEISSRNFPGHHHPVVKRADKFVNDYIGVRGW